MIAPWFRPDRASDERRYDGPVLPADPLAAALAHGAERARLFQRLAGERRQSMAARRRRLDAAAATADPALSRWQDTLALYRHQAVGWGFCPDSA